MAQVVAHHQRGALIAVHGGTDRRMPLRAAPETRPGDPVPQVRGLVQDARDQRPLDAHGVVVARRRMPGSMHVVDDIDAANKGHASVHHHQLTVQAPQAVAPQGEGRGLGSEYQHLDIGRGEQLPRLLEDALGAEAVDEHMHAHAAPACAHERSGDASAGVVVCENVSFDIDLALRRVEGLLQRRKIGAPVHEQLQLVAAQEFQRHRSSSSTLSAA